MIRTFVVALILIFTLLPAQAQPSSAVDSIKARFEDERQVMSDKLRGQKIELMKLISLDSPNQDHIKKKLDQILDTERQRQYLFVDEMFAVRESMTEQQWRDYRRTLILMMMNKNTQK